MIQNNFLGDYFGSIVDQKNLTRVCQRWLPNTSSSELRLCQQSYSRHDHQARRSLPFILRKANRQNINQGQRYHIRFEKAHQAEMKKIHIFQKTDFPDTTHRPQGRASRLSS